MGWFYGLPRWAEIAKKQTPDHGSEPESGVCFGPRQESPTAVNVGAGAREWKGERAGIRLRGYARGCIFRKDSDTVPCTSARSVCANNGMKVLGRSIPALLRSNGTVTRSGAGNTGVMSAIGQCRAVA